MRKSEIAKVLSPFDRNHATRRLRNSEAVVSTIRSPPLPFFPSNQFHHSQIVYEPSSPRQLHRITPSNFNSISIYLHFITFQLVISHFKQHVSLSQPRCSQDWSQGASEPWSRFVDFPNSEWVSTTFSAPTYAFRRT